MMVDGVAMTVAADERPAMARTTASFYISGWQLVSARPDHGDRIGNPGLRPEPLPTVPDGSDRGSAIE